MTISNSIGRVIFGLLVFGLLVGLNLASAAHAEDFYARKTIQMVVGLPPGGGIDTYARLLARHMGKHIPGNPNFVVLNMPGASSVKSVNYLASLAKPDGLTIGTFLGHVVWSQIFNRPGVQFDARQLRWLGIPAPRTGACVLGKASGIDGVEKWKAAKQPVPLGAVGVGSESSNMARILQQIIGMPIHIVPGYAGSQQLALAVESGEVSGVCLQWEAITATWKPALDSGAIFPVLQFRRTPHPALANVPLAVSLAKTDEDVELLTAGVERSNAITTSYALPPNTPEDRVAILRKAFVETLKDPAALAEAEKLSLDMLPIDGIETEKMIAEFFALSPGVQNKLRTILVSD
jgi:tripartite-type tricarboxylate transporter receptor subunit TctC